MHTKRSIMLRLIEIQRGLVEGSLDRPALLSELAAFYGELGGAQNDLKAALPPGTQIALEGAQGASGAAQRRRTAAVELKERSIRMVRYWIIRTGRNAKTTAVSDDRVRAVAKVLKTKTDEEAMQAIANCADDDWRQGDNDRGKRYDGIEHIFGKGIARFEELRDSGEASLDIDTALDDGVGRPVKQKKGLAELKAEHAEAVEHKKRARKGGDRDAFNRWSRKERNLRRQVEGAAS